jgi:lipid II:glycine glycyltransferase (peptidoglycan interpeptide bridge formation enzyme)
LKKFTDIAKSYEKFSLSIKYSAFATMNVSHFLELTTPFENNLWQSPLWEKFCLSCGFKTWRLSETLVIRRPTAASKFFLEIPRPFVEKLSPKFWQELYSLAKVEKAIFARVFPADEEISPPTGAIFENIPEIFPEQTLIINLQRESKEILNEMKPKGRYNIFLAERKGVTVERSDDVGIFYKLLEETATRDGFGIHDEMIYRKMLESFDENGYLLVAFHEKKPIAAGIFLVSDDVMTYYYGASQNNSRHLMAPYLLQWKAIEIALERNLQWYDFLGIAPENDPYHRLKGVTEFKEKFGGVRKKYAPAFEIIYDKFWYKFFHYGKKARGFFQKYTRRN